MRWAGTVWVLVGDVKWGPSCVHHTAEIKEKAPCLTKTHGLSSVFGVSVLSLGLSVSKSSFVLSPSPWRANFAGSQRLFLDISDRRRSPHP